VKHLDTLPHPSSAGGAPVLATGGHREAPRRPYRATLVTLAIAGCLSIGVAGVGAPAAYADDTPGAAQQATAPPVSVADLAGAGLLAPDVIAQLPPDLVAAPDLIVIAEVPEWWNKFGVLVNLARIVVIQVNVFLGGRGLPLVPLPPQVPTEQVQPAIEDPTDLPPGGPPGGAPPEPPPLNTEGAPPIEPPLPGEVIPFEVPLATAPAPPVTTTVSAEIVPPAPAPPTVPAYNFIAFLSQLRCGYYPSEGQWSFSDAQRSSDCGALDHVRRLLPESYSSCMTQYFTRAAQWAATIRDDGIRLSAQAEVARAQAGYDATPPDADSVCDGAEPTPGTVPLLDPLPAGYGTDAYISNIAAQMNRPPAGGVSVLPILAGLLLLPVGGPAVALTG
jgi:hypothetical protein